MAALRVLSIAVASGRAGYVYLRGSKLSGWGTTVKGAKNSTEIAGFTQALINDLKPDVVVTEKCSNRCRKGEKSQVLISAIAETASHNYLLDVAATRPREFQSKYEEAIHLANQYPDLKGHLPKRKRRIFDFEPRNMIIFEALALALEVLRGSSTKLAAAMG